MRFYERAAILASGALLATGGAFLISQGLAVSNPAGAGDDASRPIRESQLRQTPPPAATKPAPTPAKKPVPNPAPSNTSSPPKRVETITYDAWIVTCQDNVSSVIKKACVASLRITDQNKRQTVVNWQIGFDESGRFVTAIHAPPGLAVKKDNQMVGGGLLMANGVELKFGNGQPRRLSYTSCNPRQCMAEAAIDDGFVKEALANTAATITFYTSNGGPVALDVSIKGIDKAISSARTR